MLSSLALINRFELVFVHLVIFLAVGAGTLWFGVPHDFLVLAVGALLSSTTTAAPLAQAMGAPGSLSVAPQPATQPPSGGP